MFRRAFLVTFRTFATSTEVFDLLVAQYELEEPQNLTKEEFDHWRREKLRPTQKRVLTILTMWLEEYDLLNQDPEVAPILQNFLSLIISPAMALTARHMLQSLERLVRFKALHFRPASDSISDVCRARRARSGHFAFKKVEEGAERRQPRVGSRGHYGIGPASLVV